MEAQLAGRKNHDEITVDYDDIWLSGSEETAASSPRLDLGSEEKQTFIRMGLVLLEQESVEFKLVKRSFLKGMEYMGDVTDLIAVHKNNVFCNLGRQVSSDSFRIFSQAVANNCGGNANVRYAWYGGSLNELLNIVSSGFTMSRTTDGTEDNDSHGFGIHLFPAKFSLDGAMSTVANADGSRHMLLCRVILGRVEAVPAGSKQRQPSSVHYNSGVDNVSAPRKYIIWTAFMNSHIHPDYIISFKYTFSDNSPRLSYPVLIAKLSKYVEPSQMALLAKGYRQYQEGKITRRQCFLEMRKVIGDRQLVLILRN